jgi:hypothetical protein
MQTQARMNNPAVLLPDAMKALWALKSSTENGGIPATTLIVAIANINVWNRLNVAVRQPVGEWQAG